MSELGLIETMKVVNGKILLKNLHIQRIYNSLQLLKINETEFKIEDRILRLLKYECIEHGLKNFRLRIEIHKNRANDYSPEIATLKWNCTLKPLEDTNFTLNEIGLKLTVLPKHKKIKDSFANIKHTERSIYTKAAEYALQNDFDDAIVLNENNTIADTSIFNIFIIKDNFIYTPSLQDAPVDGILRTFLLKNLNNFKIIEQSISIQDVYNADEIFVTNAIRGIRWVEYFEDKRFQNTLTKNIFTAFQDAITELNGFS